MDSCSKSDKNRTKATTYEWSECSDEGLLETVTNSDWDTVLKIGFLHLNAHPLTTDRDHIAAIAGMMNDQVVVFFRTLVLTIYCTTRDLITWRSFTTPPQL